MSGQVRRTRRGSALGAVAFREWSAYWVGLGTHVPPIRELVCEDNHFAVLAVPVASETTEQFVQSRGNGSGPDFQVLPSLLLDERIWLGHWSVLLVSQEASSDDQWD